MRECGSTIEKTTLYTAAAATTTVQFMGPRTCGSVPVKSAMMRSPSTVTVTWIWKGSGMTPSSSTHISAK